MNAHPVYKPATPADVDRMVAAHPFALVISANAGVPIATPLPLLMERDGDGAITLLGHMPRVHPHTDLLRAQPRALAVFTGAHGYISPSWLSDRTQAPTWNYETVQFDIEVEFDDSDAATELALNRLVDHMEQGRPQAWSVADMGARYAKLAPHVVAFRARVVDAYAKFKLGQNERPGDWAEILAGLERTRQQALLDAMQRASPSP
ncbi:FMN-binding negative transcriptional regulator [Lysobacter sp. 5GHs7-4]|uniref:FMN-binding negative transcriptional regulator n=1 Tax=Lysobacter sp. 5GHs7-4 TaxID=2904253 RepID=UPI001E588010|nr:FMN-binding negative transcriptional regulator [Lysobacter sp. 5GHs7-4]UHQ24986.1 FMN-binding negative transcriptional regulator [Lysobacter sp. 5GHs7-4]